MVIDTLLLWIDRHKRKPSQPGRVDPALFLNKQPFCVLVTWSTAIGQSCRLWWTWVLTPTSTKQLLGEWRKKITGQILKLDRFHERGDWQAHWFRKFWTREKFFWIDRSDWTSVQYIVVERSVLTFYWTRHRCGISWPFRRLTRVSGGPAKTPDCTCCHEGEKLDL